MKIKNTNLRKLGNDYYSLFVEKLIKDCGLGVGDEIWIYWYPYL